MNFDVTYTNGEDIYILRFKDGGAALVNCATYTADRSDTEEKYLRMGVYESVETPLDPNLMQLLDDILNDRLESVEMDPAALLNDIFSELGLEARDGESI